MDARVKMDRMMTAGEGRPEFSVVSPVRNEAENVDALVREIATALSGRAFEIIFVDDASQDDTRAHLQALKAEVPQLRVLGHRKNAGQSRAVRTGVVAARANVIVTLDGDGQNDPADIPGLLGQLNRSDAPVELALIQGRRAKRIDSGWKKMGSRLANRVRRSVLKDANSDSGCGMRAFRRDAYMLLPYFDHMHRYLPALMMSEGMRVEERPVGHRARQHGRSNYTNFGRLAVAISDMRGVMWLRKRRRSPGGVDEI
ncbi:MAG: glycosyltransferase family 2 protein [Hyphomonadaceae bacterium]